MDKLKENFYRNWKNYKFIRIAFSALASIVLIAAFCGLVYVIAENPLILIFIVLAALAAGLAKVIYETVSEVLGDYITEQAERRCNPREVNKDEEI